MATRSAPNAGLAREARFNQQIVERFRSDPRAALEHANFRNDRVARVLCYLGALRALGRIRETASVACEAAQRQHFSSSGAHQAAHYLPGQILVDGAFPWRLIQDPRNRLRFESLFADVEHLPANFNKADSAAEDKGLKEVFAQACQAVIRRTSRPKVGLLDRAAARDAYLLTWRPGAERAIRAAMQQKDSRPHLPELQKDRWGNILNLEERGNAGEAQWRIEEQLNILRHYLASLQALPPALSDAKMTQFEREFAP